MRLFLGLVWMFGCTTAPPPPIVPPTGPVADASLPPRALFAGNPDYANVQLSPDGKWLSYVAPHQGVMNIWLAPSDDPSQAAPLTQARDRPIRRYHWAKDQRHLLFLQDTGGDENFHLFKVDVTAKTAPVDLTPFVGARAEVLRISPRKPNEIAVALNDRDPSKHDVYRIDLSSGARTLALKNEAGWLSFVLDGALEVQLVSRQRSDGGVDVLRRDPKAKEGFATFIEVPMEDNWLTGPVALSTDDRILYLIDSRQRDTAALVAYDTKTWKSTLLAEDPQVDVDEELLTHPRTGAVQAVVFDHQKPTWRALDPEVAPDLELLQQSLGTFSVTSRTYDDQAWVVLQVVDAGSPQVFLYRRATRALQPLFALRPALSKITLAPMHPRVIPSRDGLQLVSYLTLPPAADPDGDGQPASPLPLVLVVHGGPWGRDYWGYNGLHQWLASRGYAVLSTNFRGSTGFGKKFLNAANGEWGAKMHEDLLDAVDWAIQGRIAHPERVAIYGGSYGGYAALVGLTFSPERFACAVDIVGPSNLVTLLQTIPPYWAPMLEMMIQRIGGDHRTPTGRAFLTARSPLSRVEQIKRPLLIGQGANDPRVKQGESDQIVQAMQGQKIPVTYVLFSDEGHGFARPENRLAFDAVAEIFLSKCLGGPYQPIGGDFQGSTIRVLAGADQVVGLPAALPAQ